MESPPLVVEVDLCRGVAPRYTILWHALGLVRVINLGYLGFQISNPNPTQEEFLKPRPKNPWVNPCLGLKFDHPGVSSL